MHFMQIILVRYRSMLFQSHKIMRNTKSVLQRSLTEFPIFCLSQSFVLHLQPSRKTTNTITTEYYQCSLSFFMTIQKERGNARTGLSQYTACNIDIYSDKAEATKAHLQLQLYCLAIENIQRRNTQRKKLMKNTKAHEAKTRKTC